MAIPLRKLNLYYFNMFLLLCTHQAQKLLNLSQRTPSKMRVSARAVRATTTKIFFHVQKYLKYLKFAYSYEKIKTRFSKPFWIQQIFEKSAFFWIFEHFRQNVKKMSQKVRHFYLFLIACPLRTFGDFCMIFTLSKVLCAKF